MASKSYRALFFNTSLARNNTRYCLRDILPALVANHTSHQPHLPVSNISNTDFQIRDVAGIGAASNVIQGVFGRLRDDAPNKIDNSGNESQLALLPTDKLVEKCYFLYFANTDILVWQSSRDVASPERFAEYLSTLISNFCSAPHFFNLLPIVDPNSLQRVLNGSVKSIECKVARPNTPVSNQPQWNQNAFDLMNSVNGATIKINVSAARGILQNTRSLITQLVSDNNVSLLKVKIDGDDDPIDLFADRVDERFTVNLNGHYPLAQDVLNHLDSAYNNQRNLLISYFDQRQAQSFP